MRFDHNLGEVRRVIIHDKRSITVVADFLGEGDPWQGELHLTLSESDTELTIRQTGQNSQSHTSRRCLSKETN